MTVNAELALAAARVRLLTEQLPEDYRPDVTREWSELLDQIEGSRSEGSALLAIIAWREDFEWRMSSALVNIPLTPERTRRP